MRDFRVTTIFEGTSEIHSLYPALFMIRQLVREMPGGKKGRIQHARFIIKRLLKACPWRQRFEARALNRAVGVANRLSRHIRFLVCFGLLFYGKGISERQFLLRRISLLSVYYLAIVAVVARLNALPRRDPRTGTDLSLLALLIDEALRFKRANRRLGSGPSETLIQRIFTRL